MNYKAPSHVEFRNSLPKRAMGKVLRRELFAKDGADPEGCAMGSVEDTG